MTPLAGWENFYVIVGSSAGALIGLQFVVITLIADMPIVRGQAQAGHAFATPTVIHFGAVLLLAGLLVAPFPGVTPAEVLWGSVGLSGIVYEIMVLRRMRTQTIYKPVFEDWLFHVLLPLTAYAILAISAYAARWNAGKSLFAVGAAALLLLFTGIHNSWDAVMYQIFVQRREQSGDE